MDPQSLYEQCSSKTVGVKYPSGSKIDATTCIVGKFGRGKFGEFGKIVSHSPLNPTNFF